MAAQKELQQPQNMDVNQEKLTYTPPVLTVIGTIKEITAAKHIGISEHICGCGLFS